MWPGQQTYNDNGKPGPGGQYKVVIPMWSTSECTFQKEQDSKPTIPDL